MKDTVLMIFESLNLGGAERHIVDLADGLQRLSGRRVVVATQGGILQKELEEKGVTHERIPGIRYTPAHILRVARAVDKLVRKYHARVMHSHSRYYNLACLLAEKFFRSPAVRIATAHNVYPDKHWLGFWPKHTICVSPAAEQYVRSYSSAKTRVILNGIPPFPAPRPAQQVRSDLGISPNELVLLNVGRLSEQKAQYLLLDAFAKVIRMAGIPPLRLLIAGEGELRGRIEQDIAKLNIGNRVSLLGNRSDIGDLMAASDIFVLSSRWEGLGIVLIEAASVGLPLVSFKVGGVVEVVRHDETGFLVEPEDTDELARSLAALIRDRRLRERMGQAGRRLYAERFTLGKCVEETERFYAAVVKSHI